LISLEIHGEKYLNNTSARFSIPADIFFSDQFIRFKESSVTINDMDMNFNGTIIYDTLQNNLLIDMQYIINNWPVEKIISLIPSFHSSYSQNMETSGLISSKGKISGIFSDSVMPLMDINIQMENGFLKYADLPFPLNDIMFDINIYTDLTTDSLSFVSLNHFSANTPESGIEIEGSVNQLFSDIYCNLIINTDLNIYEFRELIPSEIKTNIQEDIKGYVEGVIESGFTISQLQAMQFEKIQLSGYLNFTDVDLTYDSLSIKTKMSKIYFRLPNNNEDSRNSRFAVINISSPDIETNKTDSYHARLFNAGISLETSYLRDSTRIPAIFCVFNADSLTAGIDTISIGINKPEGIFSLSPQTDDPGIPVINISYASDKLEAGLGHDSIFIERLNLDTEIINDKTQEDIFLQWIAKGFIKLEQGRVSLSSFSYPVSLPSVKMSFEPETWNIQEGKIIIDNSDFELSGIITNVLSYFRGDSILMGDFSFVSNTSDLMQLMSLTSGIGNEEDTSLAEESTSESEYKGPYIVPKGVDMVLSTKIDKASYGNDTASNITGDVRIKDGILLLDELSFETPAAKMQLTAMYRTPRQNHLFLGIDYHMLDIEIEQLLTMIPDIDTLMPMLRSFSGKGEFHFSVETYLDSLYNIKKSTLLGASSITGQNLVLMDGETFSEIAKTLKFDKKTENRVDSLSAEFTIFREEIDVYPFLIVMDKYKAVIAGRHNFDLSYDYHISVVESPLPIKLGIDIKGNMDNIDHKLVPCKFPEFYKPAYRKAVENRELELRKLIREALISNQK